MIRQYCTAEQSLAPRRMPTLAGLCLMSLAVVTAEGPFSSPRANSPQLAESTLSLIIDGADANDPLTMNPSFAQQVYL